MSSLSVDTIAHIVFDLLDERLRRSRGQGLLEAAGVGKPLEVSLGSGGADFDSLELLGAAGAVNELFHLHETGVEDYLLRKRHLTDWAEIAAAGLEEQPSGITFETSGTTGEPKRVFHSWESLRQEIDYLAEVFSARTRVVATVPAHHIYGFLFTALLPERLSLPVYRVDWSRLGVLKGVLESGDLVVSNPELWRYISRSIGAWPSDVAGTSSTAPLDPEVHRALGAAGLSSLTEVYGSTETGGVGLRSRPTAPFELFPYLSRTEDGADGRPVDRTSVDNASVDVASVDVAPRLRRVLPSGESVELELRDRIEWRDARRFLPRGRIDRVVQIGGENVHLDHVEEVLEGVPGIAKAKVQPVEVDGALRLEAHLTRGAHAAGGATSRDAVMAFARDRLRPTERPVSLTFSEVQGEPR